MPSKRTTAPGRKNMLEKLARTIPDPANYRSGISLPALGLPRNIIMFRRGDILVPHHPALPNIDQHVLIVALRGSGEVTLDKLLVTLNAGHALLIFPGQNHSYLNLSKELLWLFIIFNTDCDTAVMNLRGTDVRVNANERAMLGRIVQQYLQSQKNIAASNIDLSVNVWRLLLSLSASHMLSSTCPVIDKAAHNTNYELMKRVQALVERNPDNSLSISKLARDIGMSRSGLCSKFKQQMGIAVGRYIRVLRLRRASYLIATTNESLTDISEQCGFASLYSFSRVFKQTCKVSPMQYRKKLWV